MARLTIPSVTLCAAASVNVAATVAALMRSVDKVQFADCILFTDRTELDLPTAIRAVAIPRLDSGAAYSEFMLRGLAAHIATSHCLVSQWDGFVLDADCWQDRFLEFDYVGAPWPQFDDGHDVGNGGFSLRSRKLLDACADPRFIGGHPEDVAIGRTNRDFLEKEHGIAFADRATAECFAFEGSRPGHATFGFHGIFNMIEAIGEDSFWRVYEGLDDRTTAFADYHLLLKQLRGRRKWRRRATLAKDRALRLLA